MLIFFQASEIEVWGAKLPSLVLPKQATQRRSDQPRKACTLSITASLTVTPSPIHITVSTVTPLVVSSDYEAENHTPRLVFGMGTLLLTFLWRIHKPFSNLGNVAWHTWFLRPRHMGCAGDSLGDKLLSCCHMSSSAQACHSPQNPVLSDLFLVVFVNLSSDFHIPHSSRETSSQLHLQMWLDVWVASKRSGWR